MENNSNKPANTKRTLFRKKSKFEPVWQRPIMIWARQSGFYNQLERLSYRASPTWSVQRASHRKTLIGQINPFYSINHGNFVTFFFHLC